ncbi:MAG TPA: hypothetical protein VFJ82_24415 [Longimicrobium sp.]|nr:hypothetical protein [Longimicrobium sp.]
MNYRAVERAHSDAAVPLTWVAAIDVDRSGNIYLADKTTVHVFGPDGKLVRNVGRQGLGPGEFLSAVTAALTPGDSLVAFDYETGRLTVFEPGTWRVAYTLELNRNQIFPPLRIWRVRGGRSLLAIFEAAYGDVGGREHGRRKAVVRLLNPDGSLAKDSVLAVPETQHLILHKPEGMAISPFGRMTKLALASRDRMITAWTDSLKFDVYTVDGRHLKTVRASYAPPRRPILQRERDSLVTAIAGDGFVPAASVRRALDELGATTWPLIQDVVVDDRDRIWVGITGARGGPNHWTAFDLDGGRVAEVDLPANVQLRRLRGETAWAVETDENDVPRVVVYDLKPAQTLAMSRR